MKNMIYKYNYPKIYQDLVKNFPLRTREIFKRRFGIKSKKRETLESIGDSIGITRERVRQIEENGFSCISAENQEILEKLFKDFLSYFDSKGGLKKEDTVLRDLGGENFQSYILFLLTLGKQFSRVCEKEDFYPFWATFSNPIDKVRKTLGLLTKNIEKEGKSLIKEDFCSRFSSQCNLSSESLLSYFEVSKKIQENMEGKIGLINWSEINPKGVKDKAFLVFKKENHPLHFKETTDLINKLDFSFSKSMACPKGKHARFSSEARGSYKESLHQTVHNELIKDSRFVLVGRGIYALREWGYVPGTVKDIICQVIRENKQPMKKDKIVRKVLSQRYVAESTVLMNLNNKKYFLENPKGKYILS